MSLEDGIIPIDVVAKIFASPPMICVKCHMGFPVENVSKSGNMILVKYRDSGYESDLHDFYCKKCAAEERQSRKPAYVS
jgi:hypothetical protein